MRLFTALALLALNSACMSYRAAYQADLVVDNQRVGCVRVEGDLDTTGLGIGCILSGWAYGGACWAYLAEPFESDLYEMRARMRPTLTEQGVDRYRLVREDFRKIDGDGRSDVIVVEKNVQTCDTLRIQMPGH